MVETGQMLKVDARCLPITTLSKHMVLSNCIDLSNAYWLYGQCTRNIFFEKCSVMFVICTDNVISNWMCL